MRRITILLAAAVAALLLIPVAQAAAAENTVAILGAGSGEGTVKWQTTVTEREGTCTIVEGAASGECEPEVPYYLAEGDALETEAIPASESTFVEWSYNNVGTSECELFPTNNPCETLFFEEGVHGELTAEFEASAPTQPLTLKIQQGEGTVVSDPAGIECTGAAPTTCEEEFEEGSEVALTASPAAGYRFWYWEGCDSASGHVCTETLSGAKEVRANFLRVYALGITKTAGSEPGIVKLNPATSGVACDYFCQSATYNYSTGTEVTLSSYEYAGNHRELKEFTNGTGDAAVCDGETECSFTVTEEDSSVEAKFGYEAQSTLSIEKQGGGLAFVKSTNGVYCSNVCSGGSADYYPGQEVTVSWTLGTGTSSIDFGSGSGECTGSFEAASGSCKVTIGGSDTELTATVE